MPASRGLHSVQQRRDVSRRQPSPAPGPPPPPPAPSRRCPPSPAARCRPACAPIAMRMPISRRRCSTPNNPARHTVRSPPAAAPRTREEQRQHRQQPLARSCARRSIPNCVRILLTRNPAARAALRGAASRPGPADSRSPCAPRTCPCRWHERALRVHRLKRYVSRRPDRSDAGCPCERASRTMPTISKREAAARRVPRSNDLPTGSSPLKYCFANAWLTIATARLTSVGAEIPAVEQRNPHRRPSSPARLLRKSEETSPGAAPFTEI